MGRSAASELIRNPFFWAIVVGVVGFVLVEQWIDDANLERESKFPLTDATGSWVGFTDIGAPLFVEISEKHFVWLRLDDDAAPREEYLVTLATRKGNVVRLECVSEHKAIRVELELKKRTRGVITISVLGIDGWESDCRAIVYHPIPNEDWWHASWHDE